MKGLILKDFYNLSAQGKTLAIILVAYVFLGITLGDASIFNAMIILMSASLTISMFSYDTLSKWEQYALTLPIKRKDLVASRYITGIAMALGGTLFALFTTFLSNRTEMEALKEQVVVTLSMLGLVILYLSIILPLAFKFGSEKTRSIMYVVMVAPIFLFIFLGKMGMTPPSDAQVIMALKIAPFIIIALAVLSYLYSVKVFEKRDI